MTEIKTTSFSEALAPLCVKKGICRKKYGWGILMHSVYSNISITLYQPYFKPIKLELRP